MNQKEIGQFIKAFEDFMNHSDEEQLKFLNRQVIQEHYEIEAAKLEVTVDYYLAEFV